MLCDVRVTWLHRNKTKTKYRRSAVARFSLGRTALNMEDGVVQERGTAEQRRHHHWCDNEVFHCVPQQLCSRGELHPAPGCKAARAGVKVEQYPGHSPAASH